MGRKAADQQGINGVQVEQSNNIDVGNVQPRNALSGIQDRLGVYNRYKQSQGIEMDLNAEIGSNGLNVSNKKTTQQVQDNNNQEVVENNQNNEVKNPVNTNTTQNNTSNSDLDEIKKMREELAREKEELMKSRMEILGYQKSILDQQKQYEEQKVLQAKKQEEMEKLALLKQMEEKNQATKLAKAKNIIERLNSGDDETAAFELANAFNSIDVNKIQEESEKRAYERAMSDMKKMMEEERANNEKKNFERVANDYKNKNKELFEDPVKMSIFKGFYEQNLSQGFNDPEALIGGAVKSTLEAIEKFSGVTSKNGNINVSNELREQQEKRDAARNASVNTTNASNAGDLSDANNKYKGMSNTDIYRIMRAEASNMFKR